MLSVSLFLPHDGLAIYGLLYPGVSPYESWDRPSIGKIMNGWMDTSIPTVLDVHIKNGQKIIPVRQKLMFDSALNAQLQTSPLSCSF